MSVVFIAVPKQAESLANVAGLVFRLLQLTETEERHSTWYVDEHYFRGYARNVVVEVSDSDDLRMTPKYPFCIWLRLWQNARGTIQLTIEPTEIAACLTAGGIKVFVPEGEWYRKDWDGRGREYAA